ncbi:hypothetical protein, partial [Aeromonas sp. 602396]|uniref:hypothetical protein n=1 Tax=Aeromonas sp. 602396 TaxID=2712042 RepID=UPI003B9F8723
LEYRPVTPGVAGSSPVRSATNLKAFPDGKAFLLWAVFAHKSHWFAHQNQHKAQSDDWVLMFLAC